MKRSKLSQQDQDELLAVLKQRFEEHPERHPDIAWPDVESRLLKHDGALRSLHELERTGGEPDVVGRAGSKGAFRFVDCAAESPKGRRSVCYDAEARKARKEHSPQDSALEMAQAMGVEILSEDEYRQLQQLGEFDLKTSSWVQTPPAIRELGGALFCDRRYDHVFVYHNGAQSYYAARGFRASLTV